jgi:outer membrane protein TolC
MKLSNLMLYGFLCLGLSAGWIPARLQAADTSEKKLGLAWEDCARQAEQSHPDLAAKAAAYRQARASASMARSALLPQVSASASALQTGSQEASAWNFRYGLSADQLIWDGLQALDDWAQADYQAQAAGADYQQTLSDVSFNCRKAFIALLQSQAQVELSEKILLRRRQNLDLIRLRYNAGREHHGSLALAQAQWAQAQANLAQARRDTVIAQEALRQSMGLRHEAALTAQGSLMTAAAAVPPASPDWKALLEKTPQYLRNLCQLEAARTQKRAAWGAFSPALHAQASLGRSGDNWPPDQDTWSAGLSLSWTLFNGGRRWANLDLTQAAVDQAQAQLESLARQLRTALMTDHAALLSASENAEVAGQFLAAAEERTKIAEAQYSTGLIDFNNWILIENDLVSAQTSLLNSKAQALNAEAEWRHAQGGTFHE